jgi:drug/metabolite transporter (DMT)-like permease
VLGDFLAFGRMTVGCLGFLVIILLAKRLTDLRTTKISFSVVAGGLAIGASLALYVSSTLMTSIANAVFLIYTGPLFSAILAWIFLKERISARNAVFLTLVFIGMAFTIGLVSYDRVVLPDRLPALPRDGRHPRPDRPVAAAHGAGFLRVG